RTYKVRRKTDALGAQSLDLLEGDGEVRRDVERKRDAGVHLVALDDQIDDPLGCERERKQQKQKGESGDPPVHGLYLRRTRCALQHTTKLQLSGMLQSECHRTLREAPKDAKDLKDSKDEKPPPWAFSPCCPLSPLGPLCPCYPRSRSRCASTPAAKQPKERMYMASKTSSSRARPRLDR